MKILLTLLSLLVIVSAAFAQDTQDTHYTPQRIYINHADPQLIWLLLSGAYPRMPEMSTVINAASFTGGGFNSGFGGSNNSGHGGSGGFGGFGGNNQNGHSG